jgi:hypothetical protein
VSTQSPLGSNAYLALEIKEQGNRQFVVVWFHADQGGEPQEIAAFEAPAPHIEWLAHSAARFHRIPFHTNGVPQVAAAKEEK